MFALRKYKKEHIFTSFLIKCIFSFSEYAETVKGDDAVDYGAYTGGYGAFGHYASYPNFEGIGAHRR